MSKQRRAPRLPQVKAPKLLGRPMRRSGQNFGLRYAGWSFLVMRINGTWSYSICGPKGLSAGASVGGMLLSDHNLDTAERAAAELEQLISNLAIAVVTANQNALTSGPPFLRSTLTRRSTPKAKARKRHA